MRSGPCVTAGCVSGVKSKLARTHTHTEMYMHTYTQDAARVMGNTALFKQMQEASAAIKRDVVFAASLYVA